MREVHLKPTEKMSYSKLSRPEVALFPLTPVFFDFLLFVLKSRVNFMFVLFHFSDNNPTGLTTPRVRARRQQPVNNSNPPWRPWKRKHGERNPAEKLLIPLPIPHPVHIAIAIHNRDSEQPIPLDSELCWEILRAIEDCHGDLQVRQSVMCMMMFVAGICNVSYW